jgi:hypothetical protein
MTEQWVAAIQLQQTLCTLDGSPPDFRLYKRCQKSSDMQSTLFITCHLIQIFKQFHTKHLGGTDFNFWTK